ncbi:MAG: CpaE family protein [Beijerinckiaceae bacterium]
MARNEQQVFLITCDKALAAGMQQAPAPRHVRLQTVEASVTKLAGVAGLETAAVMVVDLDARNRDELVGLQQLMIRLNGQVPVIVLTESFDDAVGRWFLQIRVSDFMRKPVNPAEVIQACVKAIDDRLDGDRPTEIVTFTAAQGGVGNTTVAVETAMQLVATDGGKSRGTCLVDLDFQNDACASYLDVEPRLDLNQIVSAGDRLDPQMLDIMTVKHSSGLALLAAPAHAGEEAPITPDVILRLLDVVATRYQNVVIDLPRMWQPWSDDILRGSDRVFVVTDMTVPGLRCARRMVKRIQDRLTQDVQPKVIVNRLEKQTLFGGGLRHADVERALEGAYAGGIANNYRLVREAIDRGVPLSSVKSGNSVTEDVRKIIFA